MENSLNLIVLCSGTSKRLGTTRLGPHKSIVITTSPSPEAARKRPGSLLLDTTTLLAASFAAS